MPGVLAMSCPSYNGHTVSSYFRQKPPAPYSSLLRTVSTKFKKLQEEIVIESVAGQEFEEASRKSFDGLNGQVQSLKDAFNSLVDVLTQVTCELDGVRSEVKTAMKHEISLAIERLEDRQRASDKMSDDRLRSNEKMSEALRAEVTREREALRAEVAEELHESRTEATNASRQVELFAQDLESVVAMVPKLGDQLQAANDKLQETSDQLQDRVDRLASMVERVDTHSRNVDVNLREELEQRHQKLQSSVARQLERMGKMLIDMDKQLDRQHRDSPSPSASVSNFGGGFSNTGGSASARGGLLRPPPATLSSAIPSPTTTPNARSPLSRTADRQRASSPQGSGVRQASPSGASPRQSRADALSLPSGRTLTPPRGAAPASPSPSRGGGSARPSAAGTPSRASEAIFSMLDRNRDGFISQREWTQAMGEVTGNSSSRLSDSLRRPSGGGRNG